MYNKLFSKILDSSIWLESNDTRIVWFTLIAAMDEDGFAQFASVLNLAHRARVSPEATQEAIRCLESDDPHSSDPDNAGRRIERVAGGWVVLNAEKYRLLVTRTVARERTRERVRKHRERRAVGNAPVTAGNAPLTVANDSVTQSEAYTEANTEAEADATTPAAPSAGVAPLIVSPLAYEKLKQKNAFIGARLRVPHGLHDEFRNALGADGEARLQAWYRTVDADLEATQRPFGDIYKFLRPLYAAWATPAAPAAVKQRAGIAVPENLVAKPDAVSEALHTRARRAQMLSEGMDPADIEKIFDAEYDARKAARAASQGAA